MKSMIFLDTNIILELILSRRLHTRAVEDFLAKIDQPTGISLLTIHIVWHFARKDGINDEVISELLSYHTQVDTTVADYTWALKNEKGRDFEDALQMATALRVQCDMFVTLDKKIARRYSDVPLAIVVPTKL